MGVVDTEAPKGRARGKKKRKTKKRLGIRIDMTPMVDVVLLLLTFFMLTTVFSRPQSMEINLPPSETKVEVAESNLLTLRVMETGAIYWNMGIEAPQKIAITDLRKFLIDKNKENPKLITLVKVDRKSKYHTMVDVLDEINVADVKRFSLAPLLDQDRKEVAKAVG
jgi:biopolymer transport protein ExbD